MKAASRSLILLLLGTASLGTSAQQVGIKTNLLYDAALSPNLGVEIQTAPRWSLDISGNINAWTVNGHKWKHWLAQPEMRFWFCEAFTGHFVALHALGGQYNIGNIDNGIKFLGTDFSRLGDRRYQGWFAGAGIAYGYSWILSKHWNLEAEIGIGWAYSRYDTYPCAECGKKIDSGAVHNYVGPTKATLSIVYVF